MTHEWFKPYSIKSDSSMRRIILVSAVGVAQQIIVAQQIPAAEAQAVREHAPVPDALPPSYYGTGRRGKGEKARARSTMREKGWK